jgi:lipoprotein NlpD
MSVLTLKHFIATPKALIKTLVLSTVVVSTVVLSGCASKPLVNNNARYATAPEFYTVRSGDTLSGIATRYGLSYVSVAEMNDIAEPYRIYVGQSIRLKNKGQRTTNTVAIAQTANIQRQNIALPTATQATTPAVVSTQPAPKAVNTVPATQTTTASAVTNGLRWVRPTQGAVLQHFDAAKNIKGTRYAGNAGDAVVAAADGQVVYAADGLPEYGNLVLVKHTKGYITAYAHNSKMLVKSGQNVAAGQKIAEVGSTGTKLNMLEFQVRLDGKPINPSSVLPNN